MVIFLTYLFAMKLSTAGSLVKLKLHSSETNDFIF